MRTAIILGLCLFLFFSCSESEKDIREEEQWDTTLEDIVEGGIKYKIELLSLKHNISSTSLKQELIEYLKSQDPVFQFLEGTKNDKLDPDKTLELLTTAGNLDLEKLTTISKKYNIPMNTLASILYDYEIWASIEECENP